ncbi:MAG: DNA-3-methyladenine glycosylase [Candidatus Eremiobacteraeota bacterium]|nr:DNA-3-methyladenine glycosylase [Candidatus Eremiobacteraeota bacterium]
MSFPADFFERDTEVVARELVGCHLCHGGSRGRIVEVEAYRGHDDPASHAFRGPTPRSQIMFGQPARAYVYLSYGVHRCLNVVAHRPGLAGAVLLRALEPIEGIEEMRRRRGRVDQLASGPGRLCQAMGVELSHDGTDLLEAGGLVLYPGPTPAERVVAGPRIGISVATEREYRFWLEGNPHVSKWRGASRRRAKK